MKGRDKVKSFSEERKLQRKGMLSDIRAYQECFGRGAGYLRPRRDAGLIEKRPLGKTKGKLKGEDAYYVASSTYFAILPPFLVNNNSAVTLSGPG